MSFNLSVVDLDEVIRSMADDTNAFALNQPSFLWIMTINNYLKPLRSKMYWFSYFLIRFKLMYLSQT